MNSSLNYENILHIAKFSNFKTLLYLSYISKFFSSILQSKIKKRFNKLSWTIIIEYTTKNNINIKNISLTLGIPYNYNNFLHDVLNLSGTDFEVIIKNLPFLRNFRYNTSLLYVGKIKDIIDYLKIGEISIMLHLDNKTNTVSLVNNYDNYNYNDGYYYYETIVPKIVNLDEHFDLPLSHRKIQNGHCYSLKGSKIMYDSINVKNKLPYESDIMILYNYKKIKKVTIKQ